MLEKEKFDVSNLNKEDEKYVFARYFKLKKNSSVCKMCLGIDENGMIVFEDKARYSRKEADKLFEPQFKIK